MADSGIQRVDDLLRNADQRPITGADSVEAIGAIQDLLRGHNEPGLPNVADPRYGLPQKNTSQFEAKTLRAIHHFQKAHGLPVKDTVDAAMLRKLVTMPPKTALATRPYLTLVLDQPWTPVNKLVSVVAVAEGGGRFTATCPNKDHAGLSVGIIQWAQKPGRLYELLQAWNAADPKELSRIFGGDTKLQAVLGQAKKAGTGLNADGTSKDPNLEFTKAAFLTAFREALNKPKFQVGQVTAAGASFAAIGMKLGKFAKAIKTAKGVAFMIDLANQHGPGGAKSIYQKAVTDGMTEIQALEAMRDESIRRVSKQFPARPPQTESNFTKACRIRRQFYIDTTIFGDDGPPRPPIP